MRVKKPTLVITFPTTTAALGWERQCEAKGVPGRLIPVPVTITDARGRLTELEGLPYSALIEMEL